MTDSGLGLLGAVAVRTAVVFVLLLAGLRLTGKRQAGELNMHDVLLVLILANAVQNAMTRGDGRLLVALVSAGTLVLVGVLTAVGLSRRPTWEKWAVGEPTVLVEDGRMIRPNMRSEGVTESDLMAAVRQEKITDLADVRLAVLEVDGTISVIPRDEKSNG